MESRSPSGGGMKLISWNVNGIRALLKKGFEDKLKAMDADIVCLQETKISQDILEKMDIATELYPYQSWYCADRKGYSGTAILSRKRPAQLTQGLGKKIHDQEGRVQTADFRDFYLVNVYTPNAQAELARLDYREKKWDVDFRSFLKKLDQEKPVIFCGDLNVAHQEIDIARPRANRKNAGFTDEERHGFTLLLKTGFKDTFREFHPDQTGHYTWWSYRGQARAKNVGWRLDYFGISERLMDRVQSTGILKDVDGSDHVPVLLELV